MGYCVLVDSQIQSLFGIASNLFRSYSIDDTVLERQKSNAKKYRETSNPILHTTHTLNTFRPYVHLGQCCSLPFHPSSSITDYNRYQGEVNIRIFVFPTVHKESHSNYKY